MSTTFTPAIAASTGKACKLCVRKGALCRYHAKKAPGAPTKASKPVAKKLSFEPAPKKALDFGEITANDAKVVAAATASRFQHEDDIPKTKSGRPCKRCINKQAPCWQHTSTKTSYGKKGAMKYDLSKKPKAKPGRKAPKASAKEFKVGHRAEGLDGNTWEVREVTRKASKVTTYNRWFKVLVATLCFVLTATPVSAEEEGELDFSDWHPKTPVHYEPWPPEIPESNPIMDLLFIVACILVVLFAFRSRDHGLAASRERFYRRGF